MKALYLLPLLLTTSLFSQGLDGEQLAQKHCASCHLITSNSDRLTNGKMGGPPMWGVLKKMKQKFPTQEEATSYIMSYALEPSEEKMLFPQATRDYFGVMPSVQGKVTKAELQAIANYLYKSTRERPENE